MISSHVVEVSGAARDGLQGLHRCLLGWRAACRPQLLEVGEPLSQRQQRLRFVSAGNWLREHLVKCCGVLSRAGRFLCVAL